MNRKTTIFLLLAAAVIYLGSCSPSCSCYCFDMSMDTSHSYKISRSDCKNSRLENVRRSIQAQNKWDSCEISIAK